MWTINYEQYTAFVFIFFAYKHLNIYMIIEGIKSIPTIIEGVSSISEALAPTSGALTGIAGIPSAQRERGQFED